MKYIAPEIISGEKYNHMSDWWSLAVIIYRMITGKLPYPTNKNSEVRIFLLTSDIEIDKNLFSDEAADLLYRFFQKNPFKRLGARGVEEIMEHEFFEGVDWEALLEGTLDPPFKPQIASTKDVSNIHPKFLEQDIHSYAVDDNDLKVNNLKNQYFEDFTFVSEDVLGKRGRETVAIKHPEEI